MRNDVSAIFCLCDVTAPKTQKYTWYIHRTQCRRTTRPDDQDMFDLHMASASRMNGKTRHGGGNKRRRKQKGDGSATAPPIANELTFDGALLLLECHEDPDPLCVRRVPSLTKFKLGIQESRDVEMKGADVKAWQNNCK